MKKLFFSIAGILVFTALFNSCAGVTVCGLDVNVYLQDENGNYLSEEEMKNIVIKYNGRYVDNHNSEASTHKYHKDKDGKCFMNISYYLGSAVRRKKIAKIRDSYISKMKNFYFTVYDKSGTYADYEMKPLKPYGYKVKKSASEEYVSRIEYTVQLKKK